MKRNSVYPFTAIVGQEDMKLALILNVINPALGGVLIKGEKRYGQVHRCQSFSGTASCAADSTRLQIRLRSGR